MNLSPFFFVHRRLITFWDGEIPGVWSREWNQAWINDRILGINKHQSNSLELNLTRTAFLGSPPTPLSPLQDLNGPISIQ